MNGLLAALQRDRLILALATILGLAGVLALGQMPKQEDPSFPYRGGIVTAVLPGAGADTLARRVAPPIERQLAQIEGIDEIRTTARQDAVVISVQLRDDIYDTESVWTRVREALARAQSELPAETQRVQLDDRIVGAELAVYGIFGGDDPVARRTAAQRLRDRLAQIDGVASARLSGDPGESIALHLDRAELRGLGLRIEDVARAVQARSEPARLGALSAEGRSLPLSLDGGLDAIPDLAQLPLTLADGSVLPLGSLARIERRTAMPSAQRAYVDGAPMVAVEVRAAREAVDVLRLGAALRAEVERMRPALAPLQVREVFYQPQFTEDRLGSLLSSLLTAMGLILAVLIVAMGLRPALVVAAILPMVTASTLALYAMGGGVLQQIAVIGMVVALGILVDNAIVVVESIQRRLDAGQPRVQAMQEAVRELAMPLLSATGTTIAAFLPLLLSSGNTADFTRGIPIAITLSLAVSYVFAVLVTPLLALRLLRAEAPATPAANGVLERWAIRLCGRVVELHRRHPRRSLLLGGVLVFGSLASFPLLQQQFFPDADRAALLVEVQLPDASHPDRTDEVSAQIEAFLRSDAQVGSIQRYVGFAGPTFYYNLQRSPRDPSRARLLVETAGLEHNRALLERIARWSSDALPGVDVVPVILRQGPPAAAPIEILVFHPDRAELVQAVEQVTGLLRGIEGSRAVRHSLGQGVPALQVQRSRGAGESVDMGQAALAAALAASTQGWAVATYRGGEEPVPIRLHLAPDQSTDAGALLGLPVGAAGLPLAQIAALGLDLRPGAVERRDLMQVASVSSELQPGFGFGGVLDALREALAEQALPAGTEIRFGGEAENAGKANDAVVRALPLGAMAFLFFLLLQFNSMSRVGLVLASLPFALAGVFPALLLAGLAFGFQPLQGVFALIGITVNNAILLLSAADDALAEGASPDAAVLQALDRRIRPILLTTATTVVGLLPLVWSDSTLWPPLAWAMIGGLLASAWLSLTVLPLMLRALLRWQARRGMASMQQS
jgi:multidrug efflux pump subunit AcrB